jgi:hypothetical protein
MTDPRRGTSETSVAASRCGAALSFDGVDDSVSAGDPPSGSLPLVQ